MEMRTCLVGCGHQSVLVDSVCRVTVCPRICNIPRGFIHFLIIVSGWFLPKPQQVMERLLLAIASAPLLICRKLPAVINEEGMGGRSACCCFLPADECSPAL